MKMLRYQFMRDNIQSEQKSSAGVRERLLTQIVIARNPLQANDEAIF
jgi:hypothetical protein